MSPNLCIRRVLEKIHDRTKTLNSLFVDHSYRQVAVSRNEIKSTAKSFIKIARVTDPSTKPNVLKYDT